MTDGRRRIYLRDPEETARMGRTLGRFLFDGAVVGLSGPLGAGKTALARSIAEGMGVDEGFVVSSPTYTIMQSYPCSGRVLHHLDLYRIDGPEDLDSTGYRDTMGGRAVLLVEWPEREPAVLPPEHLVMDIEYAGEGREVTLFPAGEPFERLVEDLLERLASENGRRKIPSAGS